MNFKQATTHVLILSVIQRVALQNHCLQHWGVQLVRISLAAQITVRTRGNKDSLLLPYVAMCCSYFSFPLGIRLLGMNRITLLFVLYLVTVLVCVSSKPFHQSEELKSEIDNHTVEKRSIFGLSAFVLTLLNTILAISLNSSINTQNAEHGGIVG